MDGEPSSAATALAWAVANKRHTVRFIIGWNLCIEQKSGVTVQVEKCAQPSDFGHTCMAPGLFQPESPVKTKDGVLADTIIAQRS
jgi:hypothetical protein